MNSDLFLESERGADADVPLIGGPQIGTAFDVANEAKRQDLRRMKRRATALLLVATAVFIACRVLDVQGAWGYLRAGAEAAMVGGLADWFAVTALFRHPLGLPIPHTAIIPTRKDQIGESLGEFVQTNFLDDENIAGRLEGYNVSARVAQWVLAEDNSATIAKQLGTVIGAVAQVASDDDLSQMIATMVTDQIRDVEAAPLAGRVLEMAIEVGTHDHLFDSALQAVENFLQDNREMLRNRLRSESPWWIPESIDDRIFLKIYDSIYRFLGEINQNPDHEFRSELERRSRDLAARLQNDPELAVKGEEIKAEILSHPEVRRWAQGLWLALKDSIITAADDPTSDLSMRLNDAVRRGADRVLADPELQERINRWVTTAVRHVTERLSGQVANLISSTVERWDAQDTAERIEVQVGRDLQFIRINGTLVGGIAGVVIHGIGELIG
jgi:uncharacterized membrane-anchored protein YjiN (DUF445 family)